MQLPQKHRINVVLTVQQYNALREIAQSRGESVATIIRESIDLRLSGGRKHYPKEKAS